MDIKLAQSLNKQLTYERYSADLYYSLACQLDYLNLTGFAKYMHKRADEERTHARKIVDYLADREVLPLIDAVEKPELYISSDIFKSAVDAFTYALEHEKTVTERLWEIHRIAKEVGDAATEVFMHWFITEQVEEERTLDEILTKLDLSADNNGAVILMLNESMGE